jgi:hypothetical protein
MYAGSARRRYRHSELFRTLRDTSRLEGKCGPCEYRNLCGGSRSRAYALTGNILASDPRCVYQHRRLSYHRLHAAPSCSVYPGWFSGQRSPRTELAFAHRRPMEIMVWRGFPRTEVNGSVCPYV